MKKDVALAHSSRQTIVIKECRPDKERWRDPIEWRDQKPREIRMHQLIDDNRQATGGVGHENIIQCEGYRLMMNQRRYRLFLPLYQGKDLHSSLESHFQRTYAEYNLRSSGSSTFHECQENHSELPEILSERLILEILLALVAACQIMRYGQPSQQGRQELKPGWKPINHCDLKMNNIFVEPSKMKPEEGEPEKEVCDPL